MSAHDKLGSKLLHCLLHAAFAPSQHLMPFESPDTCACVPDTVSACAAMFCPVGTNCIEQDGEGYCVSDGTLACGTATCGEGSVCCNPSCGICTPPGHACIQIACLPEE